MKGLAVTHKDYIILWKNKPLSGSAELACPNPLHMRERGRGVWEGEKGRG